MNREPQTSLRRQALTAYASMHVLVLTFAGYACIMLALYLQQFFILATLKRLLQEERTNNAETTVQALRSLETSFAERIRHIDTRTEQMEFSIDAARRPCMEAAERSSLRNATHRRADEASGWINASCRDMRSMDAGARRDARKERRTAKPSDS